MCTLLQPLPVILRPLRCGYHCNYSSSSLGANAAHTPSDTSLDLQQVHTLLQPLPFTLSRDDAHPSQDESMCDSLTQAPEVFVSTWIPLKHVFSLPFLGNIRIFFGLGFSSLYPSLVQSLCYTSQMKEIISPAPFLSDKAFTPSPELSDNLPCISINRPYSKLYLDVYPLCCELSENKILFTVCPRPNIAHM